MSMHVSFYRSLLVGLGLFTATARAAETVEKPAPPLTIAQQIDALLKRRLKPEPLPLDLPNPFLMSARESKNSITTSSAGATAANDGDTRDNSRPMSNADILADCISRLRFGGVVRLKDQIQLYINDVPRREGDVLKMPWNGAQITVRVQRIFATEVVLRYLDVDATVRF